MWLFFVITALFSRGFWPRTVNKATPLMRPIYFALSVTVLTGVPLYKEGLAGPSVTCAEHIRTTNIARAV